MRLVQMARSIASGLLNGDLIALWNANSGKSIATFPIHSVHKSSYAHALAFSPDGKTLALVDAYDGTVSLWELPAGMPRSFHGKHKGFATSVAFSPDGKFLALGTDKMAYLFDATNGEIKATLNDHVDRLKFSPDGKTLACSAWPDTPGGFWNRQLKLWNVAGGKNVGTAIGVGTCGEMAFRPDGKMIAKGGGVEVTEIQLLDLPTTTAR